MESSEIPPKRTKPIIGIAGGIGAGKSTVARILESLGASVSDAEHQTHEQLADPEVVALINQYAAWALPVLMVILRLVTKTAVGGK